MNLSTPVEDAGKLYNTYAKRLQNLDIYTLKDFLYHLPHRYDDYSHITPINSIRAGEVVTVRGTITDISNHYTKSHKQIQKAQVTDETGTINVVWFNQAYITKTLRFGDKIALSGRVESDGFQLSFSAPDFEVIPENGETIHTGRLVPIYPETAGVSSKWIRRQVYKLLQQKVQLTEFLPTQLLKKENLMDYYTALKTIHFPTTLEEAQKARERLGFDEVFLLQLAALKRKTEWRQTLKGHAFTIFPFQPNIQKFWEQLPFEPTQAQRRVIHEIFTDLEKPQPMNRLVQGDVGSGKTVVAAIAMYLAYLNGYQSVLMAPTQILAQQHYATISQLLEPLGVKAELRTGSTSKNSLNTSTPDILIGTHAVMSETVQFEKLGLIVIDEQHRFGVQQRGVMREKGDNPHVLTMTATPIPRTVALTLYGDLDLSVIDEMPKGRQVIKTWLVPSAKREGAYTWIEKKIQEGDQAFIVCPFIEESESMATIKAASVEFERLQKHIFPHCKLGLLHGKQRVKEKDAILQAFRDKKIDILVATPVVEVGIDIPNATIIVIEASERFGLAGLHQLRGRVGRGDKQSYCLLFTESKSMATVHRLKSLEKIYNGAELAELDLKLRGAGELYGTMQHGRRWLKIAEIGDMVLINTAKQEASKVFPDLAKYPKLVEKIEEISTKQVSPD